MVDATLTPEQGTYGPCENTDRELWREREGDYYANSIHVTQAGAIGINVGGFVIVKTLREWHDLARYELDARDDMSEQSPSEKELQRLRRAQAKAVMRLIGPMLDAFGQVPNDVLEMDELEDLCIAIEAINSAMEDAP